MNTVQVGLGERSYPIHIGAGLLDDRRLLTESTAASQIVLITNDVIAPLHAGKLEDAFHEREYHSLVLPDGEDQKCFESLERIMAFMLERRIERGACIVALGGGVIGDLAGFAAACYQRGIDFVQVPTTLLAQVDSSVGGKTAINHPLGKNMIGAFHQPIAVIADTAVLETLPEREFSAGLAEVIKYGLIRDSLFLDWLETHLADLVARDGEALNHAIRRSCENKAEVVAADEREGGVRALLNLGHTFGHAIETARGYGDWLHGEAVGAGMCMAAAMSRRLGWLEAVDLERVEALVAAAGLPIRPPSDITVERYLEIMSRDKKNVGGQIRLVLLEALGRAVVTRDFPSETLRETLSSAAGGPTSGPP